jgi:adenylate cyclase class 2
MSFEVELKAHVADEERVRQALAPFCSSCVREDKSDVYYSLPGGPALFRIRYESYGDKRPYVLFTHKKQTKEGNVEVNEEHEFTASSDQFPACQSFALSLGYVEYIRKEKHGWSMMIALEGEETAHAELVEVPPLGWFLEMECVLSSKEHIPSAKATLHKLLSLSGIEESQVEGRYYMEMLRSGKEQDGHDHADHGEDCVPSGLPLPKDHTEQ